MSLDRSWIPDFGAAVSWLQEFQKTVEALGTSWAADLQVAIEWLLQFQTAIVGAIGFAGIFLILWRNARLVHRTRQAANEHERDVLRVALLTELKILRNSFVRSLELCEHPPGGRQTIDVPTFQTTAVFDALVDKMSLLSSNEVAKVMSAYLSHGDAQKLMTMLNSVRPTEFGAGVRVPVLLASQLADIYRDLIPHFDEAIVALGGTHMPLRAVSE